MQRPENVNLDNWREYPYCQWSFQNVRQIIPTAPISARGQSPRLTLQQQDLGAISLPFADSDASLEDVLCASHTDALIVLHRGKWIYQWTADHYDISNPHIIFSISKSITAHIAGILAGQGLIDCEAPILDYLPDTKGGVYGECTVRHLLDMTVALNFEENYSDKDSEYMRYREATAWNPVDQTNNPADLESFLYTLQGDDYPHGELFLYRSPNTDLLGLLLERVAGMPLSALYSKYLWQPMGAIADAYVTVDRLGIARAAGGICLHPADLAQIGQLFIDQGKAGNQQVIPASWIEDTYQNGNKEAWDKSDYHHKYPHGKYRNKWYQAGDEDGVINARGIHGQILYVNPKREVVIAKLTSQPTPLNDDLTANVLRAFDRLAVTLSD